MKWGHFGVLQTIVAHGNIQRFSGSDNPAAGSAYRLDIHPRCGVDPEELSPLDMSWTGVLRLTGLRTFCRRLLPHRLRSVLEGFS